MKSFIAALRSLVLPYGRTSGRRLVLDGDQGEIRIYDDTDAQVGVLTSADPPGLTVGADGGVQAALVSSDSVGRVDFPHHRPSGAQHAAILAAVLNEGAPNEYYSLQLMGPTVQASTQQANVLINSPNADASSDASVSVRAGAGVVVLTQQQMGIDGPRLAVGPDASALPALSVEGAAGHTGHLLQASVGATVVWSMGAAGDTRVRPAATANPALSVEGATGHTGLLLQLSGAGQINFTIDTAGVITQYADHQVNQWTPEISNAGTATFDVRDGWWQRIGKLIYVYGTWTVGAAGSGATALTVSLPIVPWRGSGDRRQALGGDVSGATPEGPLSAVVFAGGAGATLQRIQMSDGSDANGADLVAGSIWIIEGWLREA